MGTPTAKRAIELANLIVNVFKACHNPQLICRMPARLVGAIAPRGHGSAVALARERLPQL
jgi:hypothetical protein